MALATMSVIAWTIIGPAFQSAPDQRFILAGGDIFTDNYIIYMHKWYCKWQSKWQVYLEKILTNNSAISPLELKGRLNIGTKSPDAREKKMPK